MKLEIGSEFWEYALYENVYHKIPDWLNWGRENRLLATGRTALNHVICDIRATHLLNLVYVPSFCCYTMIEPFVSNGVKVLFYDVLVNEKGGLDFNIDYNVDCDALLVMNYFGFLSSDINVIAEHFKKKKKVIIIEDATHSLFCKNAYNSNSDYVFASFRKWTAIPGGGLASKINSDYNIVEPMKKHETFVKMKIEGMQRKAEYINSSGSEKNIFLQIFRQSELLIERDYKEYAIDDLSFAILEQLDINKLRIKRLTNAQLLISDLKEHSEFKPLFNNATFNDCPLFVPVICKPGKRDRLKQFLIENNIFCPVHWPKSDLHIFNKNSESIYDLELSIVCDQRYDSEDMERIITVINNFKSDS